MARKLKNIKQKTQEMIKEGSVLSSDFIAFDEWDQTNPEQRNLTEEEIQQLREQARSQIKEHQKNKI